tara:strand:+ start:452 stop:1297 length:846 start_codon:yes stop_codon:yes gene_type:complete
MIVTSLGYGYISKFFFREIAYHGARCYGISDNTKYNKKSDLENILILPRSMTIECIKKSTHLVITAPPEKNKCPILSKYEKTIKDSNIRAIIYVSSTGVYGNHKGKWVNENSVIKGNNNLANKNRIKAEKSWAAFCKKNSLTLNILRLGGIYGPGRPNLSKDIFKNIIIKKDHFFSRIHVLDISRIIASILFDSKESYCWNLVDDLPATRKSFMERIIKLKKVKNYSFRDYEKFKKNISQSKKKFWEANKKVSNKKIKKKLRYTFLFPTFFTGLKYIIKNL